MTDALNVRVRRPFRRAAIAAVIVLAPLATHAVWDQVEANRMAAVVRDMRARGEAVDLSAERRPVTSPQEREATRLYQAAAILAADDFPRSPAVPGQPVPHPRAAAADLLSALAAFPAGDVPKDSRYRELMSIVAAAEPALSLIDRAAALPLTRFNPDRTYSYLVADLSTASALASVRTDLDALTANPRADADLWSATRLMRAFKESGWLVSPGTFGSLSLLLSRLQPDEAVLARLQEAYADNEDEDQLAEMLEHRRAQMLEELWPTTGRPHFSQRLRSRRSGPLTWSDGSLMYILVRPWVTHQFRGFLADLDEEIAVAREPLPRRLDDAKRFAPAPGTASAPESGSWVLRVQIATGIPIKLGGVVVLTSSFIRDARTAAQNRVAVTALAVERWRRAHGGATPPDLQALVPSLVSSMPIDPFNGQPLRFVRTADAYVIYSVGEDRRDGGGDIGAWQPDVFGPYPRVIEHDIGIRVPFKPRN